MSTEDKLKDFILTKYPSVKNFADVNNIPRTTVYSILKRGVGNSSVKKIVKICKALNISTDALADGEIVPITTIINRKPIVTNDRIEVEEVLDDTRKILTQNEFVTLEGKPISQNGVESIIDAMDIGVEIAKKKAK